MKKQVVLHGLNSGTVQIYPLQGKLSMLMSLELPGLIRIPTAPGSVISPFSSILFQQIGDRFKENEILISPELTYYALQNRYEHHMRRLLRIPLFIPPPLTFLRKEMYAHYYAPTTVRLYTFFNSQLLSLCRKTPIQVDQKDVDTYLYYLTVMKAVSTPYINTAISALTYYYKKLHINPSIQIRKQKTIKKPNSSTYKNEAPIPGRLNKEHINNIINSAASPKETLILSLICITGLTIQEVCCLKITDLSENNRIVSIKDPQKSQNRYVLLSQHIQKSIAEYIQSYSPKNQVFEKDESKGPLTVQEIQKIFDEACKQSNITSSIPVSYFEKGFAVHVAEPFKTDQQKQIDTAKKTGRSREFPLDKECKTLQFPIKINENDLDYGA